MKNNNISALIFLTLLCGSGCHVSKENVAEIRPTTTIIGGEIATPDQPELLGVHQLKSRCTSVQAGEKVLLTAAHCFEGTVPRKGSASVHAGEDFIFGDAISHEKYSDVTHAHDLAVVLLNKDDKQLDTKNNFLLPADNNLPEKLFIAGYGTTDLWRTTYGAKSELKFVNINKSERAIKEISKETLGTDFDFEGDEDVLNINRSIAEGHIFCFKPKDRTTETPFTGDSGGPLYSMNENGQPVLHGVFSIFSRNDKGLFFFCYESVFPKMAWLQDKMKNGYRQLPKGTLTIKSPDRNRKLDNVIVEGVEVATEREVTAEVIHAGRGYQEQLRQLKLEGKILLIERGEILFSDKVSHALEFPGAVGIIFYDNVEGKLITPRLSQGLDLEKVLGKTDVRFVSKKDGEKILKDLAAGIKVKAVMRISK